VFFSSDKVGIHIVADKGNVEVQIGRALDQVRDWLEFVDILGYFAPSESIGSLALSR
jgi:hypothetical protein